MLLKKHVIILLSLLLPLSLLSAQKNPENENRQETDVAQQLTPVAPLADSIINYSKLFLHTPYRYGSAAILHSTVQALLLTFTATLATCYRTTQHSKPNNRFL
jgi:hypothetical protein